MHFPCEQRFFSCMTFSVYEVVRVACLGHVTGRIQLFHRERLSEKMHTIIPKGIVGGFEFTVLQRSLKE